MGRVSQSHTAGTRTATSSSQSPALSARVTAANGEPFLVEVYVKGLRTGEDVEREADDAGDSGKVSVPAIMRRNSAPAREGEELRKSIQTELSTKIKPGFSAWPWEPLSICHCRNTGECPYGSPNGPVTPRLYPRSASCFSDA